MPDDPQIDELLRLHDAQMERQSQWRSYPPPEGYVRCDGYYGCGALTKCANQVHGYTCSGCGRTMLPTVTWPQTGRF